MSFDICLHTVSYGITCGTGEMSLLTGDDPPITRHSVCCRIGFTERGILLFRLFARECTTERFVVSLSLRTYYDNPEWSIILRYSTDRPNKRSRCYELGLNRCAMLLYFVRVLAERSGRLEGLRRLCPEGFRVSQGRGFPSGLL